MFWSYQNQNAHTRTHTFCEVFTRYKDSSLPIQKDVFTDASFGRAFRRWKENYNVWTCHFLNFCVFFPHPQLTDLFPSLHTTAPANTCSSSPLLPTPHSYHILFLLYFIIQLKANQKNVEKDTTHTETFDTTTKTTKKILLEVYVF